MPAKKPSLFEIQGKEPTQPKKPTLRQFIKENPKNAYPIHSRVCVIWYPNTWDNYSIECELFRTSIKPGHPLFEVLDRTITRFCLEEKQGILLSVIDGEGTIGFSECNIYGDWERIGNAGFKFAPALDTN